MADPIDVVALAQEVADSNFKDERLTQRLKAIVAGLAVDPSKSLPKVFDDAGLEATYRFLSNHRVTPEEILGPHIAATRERCASGDFLVVHDTTTLSFRYDGQREGLARVRRNNPGSSQAFFAHVSLAVAADGSRRPLGVAALNFWTRNEQAKGKEFERWEKQARLSSERLDGLRNAIHLMDREADDYQMFHGLIRDGHRFVVRCLNNRCLETPSENEKLHALFAGIPATVQREVSLTRRRKSRVPAAEKIHPARPSRTAALCIAAATVTLKRPATRNKRGLDLPSSLSINVVRVWEPSPPKGEKPVEWYLYTTDPIETVEQQCQVVDHYRSRWTIEEYFKAIKTGCDFEARQISDFEGLTNLFATFAPIAYRMLLIRSEARRASDEDALTVVTQDHIDILRAKGRVKLTPKPTVRQIYFAIAVLGGHIKYSKHPPGWLTLARGLEELEKLLEGWLLAKLQLRSDQG